MPREAAAAALGRLALAGELHSDPARDPEDAPVYLGVLARAEHRLAARLLALARALPPAPPPPLAAQEAALGIALNGDQRRAVGTALSEGVTVITGGPGTGKTTIVRLLVAVAQARGESWLLAAPTGRAARRLTESTGVEARTVHRLLEFQPHTRQFAKGPADPLEAHGVLVDEASMLDLRLAEKLVSALRPGTRLVLVGDADQLPSVGAGRVLADIIDSGELPVATLVEVYRQAADSGIVRNAHRINQGRPCASGERDPARTADSPPPDFFLVDRDRAAEAQQTILEIVTSRLPRLGFDPRRDVQVLCPMHQGLLGTEALNARLQEALNPPPEGQPARGAAGRPAFRVGDRVLQLRNDYDRDIFNGDVGFVVAAGGSSGGELVVDFDGREVHLSLEASRDLALAYAMSIHKSQGSEYPAVVVALHRAHRIMLRRNLLYTAVTRARRFCCVVGDGWALETAIATPGGTERWSRLSERLRSAGAGPES